ncbi:MAG: response regulator, partial [Xanthomonadaceae bacterium]|nr:response regulator [Xanthomonadaceae bacterium]
MVAKVLVVDDSAFFRKRIVEILESDPHIEVVGTAADGREAIRQVSLLKPDVVTMDIEMPVMDGITAVRRIMAIRPTPVLMFSSLSYEGAQATLDALDAGALDFLPKRFDDITRDREQAKRILRARVR